MTVDLTGVAVAVTGGVFSILAIIVSAWVTTHIKNQAMAATLLAAINNSLGALQQAATSEIQTIKPAIPGVPDKLAPAVQYVLDQAGTEAANLGITPIAIAQKVEAKIGLASIATNLAVTANPALVAEVVPPLTTVITQPPTAPNKDPMAGPVIDPASAPAPSKGKSNDRVFPS